MSFLSQGTSKAATNQDKEAGKRRDVALTLRKKKKEELLREKRQRGDNAVGPPDPERDAREMQQLLENLPTTAHLLREGTPDEKYQAATAIRKLLSSAKGLPIDCVIELRCVPPLVQLLRCDERWETQLEAAWALTNVASGTPQHTSHVVKCDAIPEFVRLLSSPIDEVRDQAVWALGNIAGDDAKTRDQCIAADIMTPLLRIIHSNPSLKTLRNATWCLSNLARNKPNPEFRKISPALPTLAALLQHTDGEVIADACWAISYASDGPDERIATILKHDITDRLMELLEHEHHSIHGPALRTVGNIVSGTDQQTNAMIKAGVLPRLGKLLRSPLRQIRKECCWALSNITAGTIEQASAVVEAGLCKSLVEMLRAQEFEVRNEAVWAITNLTDGTKAPDMMTRARHVHEVVKAGAMQPIMDMLHIEHSMADMARLVILILEFFENILSVGQAIADAQSCENSYKNEFIRLGGLDRLFVLQISNDKDISARVYKCMQFFSDMVEAEEPEAAEEYTYNPGVATGNFNF